MRVLLQGRIDLLSRFGGDSQVVLSLRKNLIKIGVDSDIGCSLSPALEGYDLVHFFGFMRVHDLYPCFLKTKVKKKPIVVMPIYEDLKALDSYGRMGLEKWLVKIFSKDVREFGKGFLRGIIDRKQLKLAILQLKFPYSRQQSELLRTADCILATSRKEKRDLIDEFKLDNSRIEIIPISIDQDANRGDLGEFKNKYGLTNFILNVGRIEPKKNQLVLLKAIAGLEIPIVFIGDLSPYHRLYVREFLDQIKKYNHVKYLGYVERKMLLSAYMAAKVHVLPSWFETMGIVSLEAALNDCNIVTTNKGYAREYFGDLAWYCDSRDVTSIRRAVVEAYSHPLRPGLKKLIVQEYSWAKTMPKILKVYKEVIEAQ